MADATPPPWMQPGAPPTHAAKDAVPQPQPMEQDDDDEDFMETKPKNKLMPNSWLHWTRTRQEGGQAGRPRPPGEGGRRRYEDEAAAAEWWVRGALEEVLKMREDGEGLHGR